MNSHVIVVGMGQLGTTFAKAFTLLDKTVAPVLRGESIKEACAQKEPALIIVAVGESDLPSALLEVPTNMRDRVVLLQNELRPDQWLSVPKPPSTDPTIAIVWFEKKKDQDPHLVRPSVLYGAHAHLMKCAYDALNIPADEVQSKSKIVHELILKNLYILGLNLTGLKVGGRAGELLTDHREIFERVVNELLTLEEALLRAACQYGPPGEKFATTPLDISRLKKDLQAAILADPSHGCAGRSAPSRLRRTLSHAQYLGLHLPTLTKLN